ncbi:trypsin-like peptidase domain-containing protein [Urechidicola vernalis]|uniref:Trypsin-like peptidase domain-containing protein n=1 Tax=Urechidicola vernalis TaxID=3075600 RepID=A0ABU2Y7W0_9FLAO|nr:trypsin-like peptidase domain-containing protein [Urechidicola sp. P050]MDT0554283.1 trypsin-like peptidase domain-containing protein [Urechidicola sp. P050]
MKKILSLVVVSALGGALTLGAYKLFEEEPLAMNEVASIQKFQTVPTNFNANLNPINTVDFTMAAEQTLTSVVHVKNKSIHKTTNPIEELFYGRSSGRERVQVGIGSGVIVSSDGYIITNNHVIDGASEIEITLNDKKTYKAELIGTDATNDIALVKVDAQNLPYVTFGDSDAVKVGEWVLAVGNPYNLTATVTAGIVSAKGRDLLGSGKTDSYLQTDAVVNSGNSGGALVNTRGELIGINTMITSTTGSYIGYSFAVPSNIAKKVIEDIMEFGNVQKAFIGINYMELNGENHNEYDVDNTEGVIITNVLPDGGAAAAGILEDDIIVKANNVKVATFADLSGFLKTKRPDDVVEFTIIRDGSEKVIPVKLYKNIRTAFGQLGLSLEELSKSEARDFDLSSGVKINQIANKELVRLGLKEGQVIKSINGSKILDVDDAETAMRNAAREQRIVLEVLDENGVTERYIFN